MPAFASPSPSTSRHPHPRAVAGALVTLALAAAGLAACVLDVSTSGTQDLEVAVPADAPSVSVRVEMFNGSIEVRAGAAGRVAATVTTTGAGRSKEEAEADRAKIQVTLDATPDRSVLLRTVYQPSPGSPGHRSASAVVDVPPGAALDLHTSNGDVATAGIRGPIQVATSNGAIRLAEAAQGATVRTSNKGVEIDGSGTFDVETSNESIYVQLPGGSSFALDARTSGGAEVVVTGFDVQTTGAASSGTLQGTVGAGGPSITLRTSNRNIQVAAQQ